MEAVRLHVETQSLYGSNYLCLRYGEKEEVKMK